jgi:hypothetical protein
MYTDGYTVKDTVHFAKTPINNVKYTGGTVHLPIGGMCVILPLVVVIVTSPPGHLVSHFVQHFVLPGFRPVLCALRPRFALSALRFQPCARSLPPQTKILVKKK